MMLVPIMEGVRIIVLLNDFSGVLLLECDYGKSDELVWMEPDGGVHCPATIEETMKIGAGYIRAPLETPHYTPKVSSPSKPTKPLQSP